MSKRKWGVYKSGHDIEQPIVFAWDGTGIVVCHELADFMLESADRRAVSMEDIIEIIDDWVHG